jgi:hypothetical protein
MTPSKSDIEAAEKYANYFWKNSTYLDEPTIDKAFLAGCAHKEKRMLDMLRSEEARQKFVVGIELRKDIGPKSWADLLETHLRKEES